MIILYLILIVFSATSYAAEYKKSADVCQQVWDEVKPYFLPQSHPAKAVLDRACSRARLTANRPTLEAAGFKIVRGTKKRMLVASHSKMKGYLIKTYLDTHNLFDQEWALWIRRVQGANLLRHAIKERGFSHLFKVPKKWIYPLPDYPPPLQAVGQYPQHFILIVEEMDIYDRKQNEKHYEETMTFELLDALYVLIKDYRLWDSLHLGNIPFCKDGRIAILDTEYVNGKPKKIKYERLNEHLSPNMKAHWKSLVKKKT